MYILGWLAERVEPKWTIKVTKVDRTAPLRQEKPIG